MTSVRPILKEMPDNIKRNIVGSLDPWTRRTIRLCSKEYYCISGRFPLKYHQLLVQLKESRIEVNLFLENDPKALTLVFEWVDEEECRVSNPNEGLQKEQDDNFVMAAGVHVVRILTNPRLSLEKLTFDMDNYGSVELEVFRAMRHVFMGWLNYQLKLKATRKTPVKHLCIRMENDPEDVTSILAHLEPGTLSKIQLIGTVYENDSDEDSESDEEEKSLDMRDIVVLEQFKRAESLHSRNLELKCSYRDVDTFDEVMKVVIPRLTLEIANEVLEDFQTQPTKQTVILGYEAIDKEDIDGFLERFDLKDGWNRVANILPMSPEEYLTIDLFTERCEFMVMRKTRN